MTHQHNNIPPQLKSAPLTKALTPALKCLSDLKSLSLLINGWGAGGLEHLFGVSTTFCVRDIGFLPSQQLAGWEAVIRRTHTVNGNHFNGTRFDSP